MRPLISKRGSVRPPVRQSVSPSFCPLVHLSVHLSIIRFFCIREIISLRTESWSGDTCIHMHAHTHMRWMGLRRCIWPCFHPIIKKLSTEQRQLFIILFTSPGSSNFCVPCIAAVVPCIFWISSWPILSIPLYCLILLYGYCVFLWWPMMRCC